MIAHANVYQNFEIPSLTKPLASGSTNVHQNFEMFTKPLAQQMFIKILKFHPIGKSLNKVTLGKGRT